MSDFTTSKTVFTRKLHKCWGCEREFPSRSQMDCVSGVYEGDFFTYYLCKPCDSVIQNNRSLLDRVEEAFHEGAVKEYCEDEGIELPAMEG